MTLRDLFVLTIVALSIPLAFRVPFAGLLTFSWLAYMRAQDLCWGFAKEMRFSFYVAIVMVFGWVVNDSWRRRFTQWDLRTRLMALLLGLTTVSLILAKDQSSTVIRYYTEFAKIMLIAFFTAGQVDTKLRLRLLLWTIGLSLGFYGIKGGIHGLLTGGAPILRGPGGMLEDNNDFALAMVMSIPLLFYLGQLEKSKWIKIGTKVAVGLTCITILLTHSRGGFLAMTCVLLVLVLRSRYKWQSLGFAVLGVLAFLLFTPEHVLARLGTIQDYQHDSSAGARLTAWQIALRMIGAYPIFGVGIRNFQVHWPTFSYGLTRPGGGFAYVAHNSYLQIWAEGGTIAFAVYLCLLGSCFTTLRRLRRLSLRAEGALWIFHYSRMFEASLAGFLVGAMFLNRGHFDLVYHLIACITALQIIAYRWLDLPVAERLRLESGEEEEMPPLEVVGPGAERGFHRPWKKRPETPLQPDGKLRRTWGS